MDEDDYEIGRNKLYYKEGDINSAAKLTSIKPLIVMYYPNII